MASMSTEEYERLTGKTEKKRSPPRDKMPGKVKKGTLCGNCNVLLDKRVVVTSMFVEGFFCGANCIEEKKCKDTT